MHINARWPQAEVKFPKHKEANNTGREETDATDENWSKATSHQATPDLSQPLRPSPEPGLSGRVEATCSESEWKGPEEVGAAWNNDHRKQLLGKGKEPAVSSQQQGVWKASVGQGPPRIPWGNDVAGSTLLLVPVT